MAAHIEWHKIRAEVVQFTHTYVIKPLKEDKVFTISLIVILLALVGWWGYKGYRLVRENLSQKAQIAFVDASDAYQQALARKLNAQSKPEEIKEALELAEVDLKQAYARHKNSIFAPFMQALLAHIEMFKNEPAQSVTTMHDGVQAIPVKSPYKCLYEVAYALMLIDSDKPELGVQQLERIAQVKGHAFQDMAGYYLGLYYYSRADNVKAIEQWKLVAAMVTPPNTQQPEHTQSPWPHLAQTKLEELGA